MDKQVSSINNNASVSDNDPALVQPNGWELLSRDQIEAAYGLSRRWLELATHRGEGPPMVKISSRMVRYRRCDLDAWIADHVVGNTAAE